jgi:hypothetical protein
MTNAEILAHWDHNETKMLVRSKSTWVRALLQDAQDALELNAPGIASSRIKAALGEMMALEASMSSKCGEAA